MFLIFAGISWIVIVKSVSQAGSKSVRFSFGPLVHPSVRPSLSQSAAARYLVIHQVNLTPICRCAWPSGRSHGLSRSVVQLISHMVLNASKLSIPISTFFFSLYQTDVHLHCEEWDRLLDEGDWEPHEIVAKLPTFLQFLRQVQRNVAPQAMAGGE